MTISTDSSAPLFVVTGSTGTLGGSVIKALVASSRPYRIRGICRDVDKPAAKALQAQGVEVVSADLGTKEGAERAFEGADIVFALVITNYGFPSAEAVKEEDIRGGKLQMDAAAQAGVKTMVWSGLSNHDEFSKGAHPVKM